ncbi:helix-turn-helix domain-containing protein [Streptomyces sp. NPDC048196]|uniref:ArsR/SmtB family transcription factor n=1 Tax=Streptomyces sp. NPDC048196 TaxID=3154712 RepID=UPI00340B0FC5
MVVAELAFSANDLAEVRFAVSPMWEVAPSFRLLTSNTAHPVHRSWVEHVRPRVRAAGLDRGWLAELIGPAGYVPDFLNPAPAGPAPTPAAEWDAIRASPADRVRQDLDHLARHQGHLGPRLRTLLADPPSRLTKVTQEIATYWELALAPYWARIRALLDADIFHRARTVAEHGAGHLFNDLHTSVSWDDNTLRLLRRKRDMPRPSAGAGLLLIPSAFTGPGLRTRVRPPDPPQLAYPARGIGTLWETRPAIGPCALAPVLGRSRTLLLSELETPASTTELAHRTGLSPAGVSQYLTALRNAGLVSAHRAGRSVLYARTTAAETLLKAASS